MTNRDTLRLRLAARLRELMEASEGTSDPLDTQHRLADRSGIGQSTIGRILRGETSVTLDNVESLASAFRVPPTALFLDSDDAARLLRQVAEMPPVEIGKVLDYAVFRAAQYADGLDSMTEHTKTRESAAPHKATTTDLSIQGTHVHESTRTQRRLTVAGGKRRER